MVSSAISKKLEGRPKDVSVEALDWNRRRLRCWIDNEGDIPMEILSQCQKDRSKLLRCFRQRIDNGSNRQGRRRRWESQRGRLAMGQSGQGLH